MTRNLNALISTGPHLTAEGHTSRADVARRIAALRSGEVLTIVGLSAEEIGESLGSAPGVTRSALRLQVGDAGSAGAIVHRLLDDLADVALKRWPQWYGQDGAASAVAQAKSDPLVSWPWLRAAVRLVEAGRAPRFKKLNHRIAFAQLRHAIDPANPVLIAAVDPLHPSRAVPVIAALEWCVNHGASAVAALIDMPATAAPYDRILYGALQIAAEPEPAIARFIAPPSRAHHASIVERRIESALRSDRELGSLFSCNETVALEPYGAPRVDLLWREGRVVVELDGPDHQADRKFADDRHRDYELLVAGYLVLRITNNEVETDLQRAIEKIRAVVAFRRREMRA